MKKLFITAALASAVCFANAQDMMSKKGTPILPEAGDWSIGFDAAPVLDYFGNLFNNTTNNSVGAAYQQNNTLVGKYMKDANTAYRAKLRIGFGSTSQDAFSDQSGSTATPPAKVTDTKKTSNMNITLGGGIQMYRGKGRLKGYYGGEAFITLGSSKNTYSYGNAINTTYQAPASHDFDGNVNFSSGYRDTERKNGSTFGFGLRGFVGAEYFFAPKMSVGAEYGWGLSLSSTGEGSTTAESYNLTTSGVQSITTKSGKSSNFGLDVDNASGSIVLALYF